MIDQLKHGHHDDTAKPSVGAIFQTREEARRALAALHKAHFIKSWFGVTSVAIDNRGHETLTAESASSIFFSQDAKGLVDALVAHGIDGDTARALEGEIEPGNAIVTVQTGDREPAEALEILERFGGLTELSGMDGGAADQRFATRPRYDAIEADADAIDGPVWEEEVFYTRTPVAGRR